MPRKNKTEEEIPVVVKKTKKVSKKAANAAIPEVIKVVEKYPKKEEKKTLLEFQQTDGKLYNKHGVRSLDELLGVKSGKYNTQDPIVYEQQIQDMNTSDLQTHAVKVGVMPNENRQVMLKRLLKEFRMTNAAYSNHDLAPIPIQAKPINPAVMKILAEGR